MILGLGIEELGLSDFNCSVVRLFTDAAVPTGMNTGVSITPCAVVIWVRRAEPSV